MSHCFHQSVIIHSICDILRIRIEHRVVMSQSHGVFTISKHGKVITAVTEDISIIQSQSEVFQDKINGSSFGISFRHNFIDTAQPVDQIHIFCQCREQGVGIGLLIGVDDEFVKVAKSALDIVFFGQSQCGEITAGSLQLCKPGNMGRTVAVLFSLEKQSCICRFYLPDDLRLPLLRDLRGGAHLIVVYNIASAATQITAERQPTDHRRQTADGPSGVDK